MISAFKQVGSYGIFEFDTDQTPDDIEISMVNEGYRPATETDLQDFLANYSVEINSVPIIATNSSSLRSDGATGKKCLIDINGVMITNYWYTVVLFSDNKYLGVHN